MMMTFVTELVRFYDQAVAGDEGTSPAKVKGLRADTEALRETMLDVIEPDWKIEEAFGRLQDAAALYSRTAPATPRRGPRASRPPTWPLWASPTLWTVPRPTKSRSPDGPRSAGIRCPTHWPT